MDAVLMTKPILALAMIVIMATCVWVLAANRKRYLFGVLFIPLVLFVAISVFYSVRSFEGWPIEKPMGSVFTLHWYVIDESQDVVYVWITERGDDRPRAHIVPYSRKIHRNLDGVRKRLRRGDAEIRGYRIPSETDDAKTPFNYEFKVLKRSLNEKGVPEQKEAPARKSSRSQRIT